MRIEGWGERRAGGKEGKEGVDRRVIDVRRRGVDNREVSGNKGGRDSGWGCCLDGLASVQSPQRDFKQRGENEIS